MLSKVWCVGKPIWPLRGGSTVVTEMHRWVLYISLVHDTPPEPLTATPGAPSGMIGKTYHPATSAHGPKQIQKPGTPGNSITKAAARCFKLGILFYRWSAVAHIRLQAFVNAALALKVSTFTPTVDSPISQPSLCSRRYCVFLVRRLGKMPK